MKIGFIGLGNVGGKLAGSLMRNGLNVSVHDLNQSFVEKFVEDGAKDGHSAQNLMQTCDVVITCLPTPEASGLVVKEMLPFVAVGKIWLEMSTTDAKEVKNLAELIVAAGGELWIAPYRAAVIVLIRETFQSTQVACAKLLKRFYQYFPIWGGVFCM